MKIYLEIEEIKKAFIKREVELAALEGRAPAWHAAEIAEVIDNISSAITFDDNVAVTNVEALCDLVDNQFGMIDCRETRSVITDAANAFAIQIFENRRMQHELEERRNALHSEVRAE